jgi:chromatin remodeling complex protein RSC6
MPKTATSSKSKKTTTQTVESTVPTETLASPTPEPVTVEVAPATVVTETVTMETKDTVTTPETEESNTEILFNKLLTQFMDVQSVMKTLFMNLKVLQKEVLRERKESMKRDSKRKKSKNAGGPKKPSGITTASSITPVLSNFLNLSENEMIARTQVTSLIIAYIKANNLQNPENKKQIIPDAKLATVLESGSDVVTFFNLQTYLKKHFLPKVVVTTTTETPATVV